MTVKELIKALGLINPNLEVYSFGSDHSHFPVKFIVDRKDIMCDDSQERKLVCWIQGDD